MLVVFKYFRGIFHLEERRRPQGRIYDEEELQSTCWGKFLTHALFDG